MLRIRSATRTLLRASGPLLLGLAAIPAILATPGAALGGAAVVDPSLRRLAEAGAPAGARHAIVVAEHDRRWVDVWLSGSIDPDRVRALGGSVGTAAGHVMTARLPLEALGNLERLDGLQSATPAQTVEFQSDVSVQDIGVQQMWGGSPPNYPASGITGRGVVLGIVDTGLDPFHEDFRTATGTRVRWLWDQNPGLSAPSPSPFGYGSEYAQTAIDARQYTVGDVDGHGTHLAGVAAGNGRATGNGQPAYGYVGAAPEADLVIVRLKYNPDGSISDTRVVEGIDYVFRKAAALGKPAVVLVALAKWTGSHDGQDPLDLAITALTGPGRVVVAPTGNFGGLGRHAEWTASAAGQTGALGVQFGTYTPTANAYDHLRAEAWYDAGASFRVSVVTPSGQVVGPVAPGATTTVQTPQGIVELSNGQYANGRGARRVDLSVYRGALEYPVVASGTWTYRFESLNAGSHRVDAWITSYALGAARPAFVAGMTEKRLVGSPATADGVLSVAAYSTKDTWVDMDGNGRFYPYARLNAIAHFSAAGPRRDGQVAPRLAAPGYGVVAAKSGQYHPSNGYVMADGVHCIKYGTSVAAAHAAGAAALLLQQDPQLDPAALAGRLGGQALSDNHTGAVPNDVWGYGKLHLEAGTTGVLDDLPRPPATDLGWSLVVPNPSRGRTEFRYTVPSSAAGSPEGVRLRVLDVMGREVATLQGRSSAGSHALLWDGTRRDGARAAAGVYLVRVEAGARSLERKFIRID